MQIRLYYDRPDRFPGDVDSRHEEECYTSRGRRVGVYLTSEAIEGDEVVSTDVDLGDVAPYEVSADADSHRTFVVPGSVVSAFTFAP